MDEPTGPSPTVEPASRPDPDAIAFGVEPEDLQEDLGFDPRQVGSIDAPTPAGPGGDGWQSRVSRSPLASLLVLLLTAALVLTGVWFVNRGKGGTAGGGDGANGATSVQLTQEGTGPPPEVGKPAQDFTAKTLEGKPLSLAGLKGHPVWISFGASWCQACQAEMPDIEAAYQKAKASGAVVVGVFITEDAATVKDYAARLGLTYPIVVDPDDVIAAAYRVDAIPAQYFIDADGILRQMHVGGMGPQDMDAALAALAK